MQNSELPPTLAREGDMMLTALVSDLLNAGYNDLFCTRDIRLRKPAHGIKTINADQDIWQLWNNCMYDCDAVWIIAPETDGVLFDLTCMSEQHECLLFGCSPAAVWLTASKKHTIEFLTGQSIPCVPVIGDITNLPDRATGWVIKPDDGVGSEGCFLFSDPGSLHQYISQHDQKKFIIQEYIQGISASISMVCHGGQSTVFGCNQQLFAFKNGKGHLSGIIVNGLHKFSDQFTNIAGQICAAIKGLSGYVGVDLVVTDQGPLVLEINPRLTTAYVGLRQSLDYNPAEFIISVLQNKQFPAMPECQYRPVMISL